MGKRITTEGFLLKIRSVFGDKYDLSKTEWNGSDKETIIICREHGEFYPIAGAFLRGLNVCPDCSRKRKVTDEEFHEKIISTHGEIFDLSETVFTRWRDDVSVICEEHGTFPVNAKSLANGSGCPDCGDAKAHTGLSFTAKAKQLHGDKYGYNSVVINKESRYVQIYCNIHKKYFSQDFKEHLRGAGCLDCFQDRNRITREDFIIKMESKFGETYSFENMQYSGYKQETIITCPVHGEINIIPFDFLRTKGCHKCFGKQHWTIEYFIEKAKETRGDDFDYTKSYISKKGVVNDILCKKHNTLFKQSLYTHLNGAGCSTCTGEKRSGAGNGNYKDGRAGDRNKDRNDPRYRIWRNELLKNESHCNCCGVLFDAEIKPDAHHLNAWYSYPKQRFDVTNGVLLCEDCHSGFHSEYSNGTNTKYDYEEFKYWRNINYG